MENSCGIEGCGKAQFCRGLCQTHYKRQWTSSGGAKRQYGKNTGRRCIVNGCNGWAIARQFCMPHYAKWKAYGDAEYVRPKREKTLKPLREGWRNKPKAEYEEIARYLKNEGWAYEKIGACLGVSRQRAQQMLSASHVIGVPTKICENCGAENRPIHGHHVSHIPEIIQWVCNRCHRTLEPKKRKKDAALPREGQLATDGKDEG